MTKREIEKKFETYRETIKANIEAIQELIDQSNNLTKTLDSIENPENKKRIEEINQQIMDSIRSLIKNTDKLFDEYIELIKEV